ncbi:MAG: hypothetical protein LBO78_03560 [Rickettsiales bacterium]|jgi:hypothetical protein|nr:hypothetical protein [Rickettsiales bacterium]
MESKNKTVLMTVIDAILEDLAWVNKNGETVSLKEALAKNIRNGKRGGIEMLARDELIGAYTSMQIRRQSFSEPTQGMADSEIADRLKLFIFEDSREQMLRLESELGTAGAARKTA